MAVEEISPRVCRTWHMHERLGEYVDAQTCALLIESVRTHGQKQPALGRRVAKVDGIEVELVYGARRLFVARHLHRKLLVDIRDLDDREALIAMDIENRVRTDISAYERGLSYRRWLSAGHFKSQAEIAKALGISEAQISRLLKYAAIPAVVIEAFDSPGDIREEWAVVLARICQDPERRAAVLRRARRKARSGQIQTPQAVYASLIRDEPNMPDGVHDEVVTDSAGMPLLRIGFRAKTVHLILPRERVSSDALREISVQLRRVLESNRFRHGPMQPESVGHQEISSERDTGPDEFMLDAAAVTHPHAGQLFAL